MAAPQTLWQRMLANPATNPKTVHFWAPVLKWGLVIAGIGDLKRPVEQLSVTQNVALFCTGAIWTRWCLIIKPINKPLASVNAFLGIVGAMQVSRIVKHNYFDKKSVHPDQPAVVAEVEKMRTNTTSEK